MSYYPKCLLYVVEYGGFGKTALFNAKEFTAYGNVRAIIDTWTAQIVIALNQIKEGKQVDIKDGEAFTPLDY